MIERLKARMTEILLMLILAVMLWQVFAAGIAVRVFESRITGGYVYCRTGSLPNDTHIDRGSATVPLATAVDCP